MTPCRGTGQFQWNTAGWFGGQIGSTAYLILLGLILAFKAPLPGLILLLCGLIPNIVGYRLWRQRDRLAPYPAIQRLMLTAFIFTAIAVGTAIYCQHFMNGGGVFSGATESAWVVLVFPGLMLLFHFQERAARHSMNAPPDAGKRKNSKRL